MRGRARARDVGDSDDAIDPLSVQDSLLAAANGVAGELDAMPSATAAVFYVEHLAGLRRVCRPLAVVVGSVASAVMTAGSR